MTSGEWDLRALKALEEEEQKEFLALSQKSLFEPPSPPAQIKQISAQHLIHSALAERERSQQPAVAIATCNSTNYVQLQAQQLLKLPTINEHHNHQFLLKNKAKSSDSSGGRLKFTKALSLSAHSLTNRLSGGGGGGLKKTKKSCSSNSPSHYGSPLYTPPPTRRCNTLHHTQPQVRKAFKTLQQLEKQKQERKQDTLNKNRTLQRIAGTNKTYWKYGIHSTANSITQQHQQQQQQQKQQQRKGGIASELESNTSSELGSEETQTLDNNQLVQEQRERLKEAQQNVARPLEYDDDTVTETGSCSVPLATDSIEMMSLMLTAASTAVKAQPSLTAEALAGNKNPAAPPPPPPDIAATSVGVLGNNSTMANFPKYFTLNHYNLCGDSSTEETVAYEAFHNMLSRRKSFGGEKWLRAQTLQRNSSLQNDSEQQQQQQPQLEKTQSRNVNNRLLLKSSSFDAPLTSAYLDFDLNNTNTNTTTTTIATTGFVTNPLTKKLKSSDKQNTTTTALTSVKTSNLANHNLLTSSGLLTTMPSYNNSTNNDLSQLLPQQTTNNQDCNQMCFSQLHHHLNHYRQHHLQNPPYQEASQQHLPAHHFHNLLDGLNGLNTTSSLLIIDNELEEHIKQCSCSCNHMGYGNSMDYQTTGFGGLPDVTEHSNIRRTISRQNSTSNSDSGGEISSIQKSKVNFNDTKSPSAATETTAVDAATKTKRKSKGSQLQHHHNNSHHHHLHHNRHRHHGGIGSENVQHKLGRSSFVIVLTLIVALGLLAVAATLLYQHFVMTPSRNSHTQRLKIVTRILREVPLVDGHNNFAWNVRKYAHSSLELVHVSNDINHKSMWVRPAWAQTDMERLKQGHVGVQVWSAYVPCEAQGLDAVQLALEQIDIIRRLTDMYQQDTVLVQSSLDIQMAQRHGLIASLIGIEGGHAIGSSLGVLRSFYSLGARYLSLTHKCDVSWASSSSAATDTGLTQFGKAVVREMNRLGMMIDLSYSSDNTARDVLQATRAPVIFSHSGARQLCNSTRNVPDDILRLVAENGGLIMISFDSEDVTCSRQARLKDVVEHIKYIRAIAGIQHIGLGAGYDGIELPPLGLEDVSKYPDLLATLLEDPHWSEEDIAMLAGKNFLRIMETVENVREFWKRAAITPIEQTEPQAKTQCTYMSS